MNKKLGIVHCRLCGAEIDRNIQKEDEDWVSPSRNYFYHKNCYEEWAIKKSNATNIHAEADNDLWLAVMWDYLTKDMKISIDYRKMKNQWDRFLKKGMTAKGIYFSLRYFYEVKHGDATKSENGIGIVSYIYNDGCSYWVEREQREKGICARIEAQVRAARKQEIIQISQRKKKPKAINMKELDLIAGMEDDEE